MPQGQDARVSLAEDGQVNRQRTSASGMTPLAAAGRMRERASTEGRQLVDMSPAVAPPTDVVERGILIVIARESSGMRFKPSGKPMGAISAEGVGGKT